MLIKESIIKVARTLKEGKEIDIQDKNILEGYPADLDEQDILKAMNAIDIVSDILLELE
jgi:flagella basal body P-ring formation protein FlgA|tara:strand:+ start:859 stop:1035 length:177 start_codon:yes stop_codon:yes gene_type:complete